MNRSHWTAFKAANRSAVPAAVEAAHVAALQAANPPADIEALAPSDEPADQPTQSPAELPACVCSDRKADSAANGSSFSAAIDATVLAAQLSADRVSHEPSLVAAHHPTFPPTILSSQLHVHWTAIECAERSAVDSAQFAAHEPHFATELATFDATQRAA